MAASYSIRPAELEDVGFLTEVSIEATRAQGQLPADFDEVEWRAGFAEWSTEVLQETSVVELDDRPVGRLRVSRTVESIELCGIQLLSRVQNRGIGTAIITALQSEAAGAGIPLDLGVEKDNLNARRLYDRLGFTKIGEDEREDKLRWQP
ncbi:ribosomal protein S18 acetylase RimI-like enzyme [Kribbella antiqua]|uniref:Ribosomal protein S18 acetylase RimI-like enzyme n=1 Tax=Kribbella antiqua TaxID=2512217 RepID=A0A4V2S4H9_9ACTN|nr:GNAT family N-acetyltransferase [Kribbella antiqua]TCO48360.1 ribosomal protein S18 acetylase RimI-like enzyme [Kribbella antiqua]